MFHWGGDWVSVVVPAVIMTPVEDIKPGRKNQLTFYITRLDMTALYDQPTSDTLQRQIPLQSVLIRRALYDL